MTKTRRCGFTLVELLVVIAILVVLMSILLPALKYAKSVAGVGMCAKQIRTINDAFHAYVNEWDEKIPWVASLANRDTFEILPHFAHMFNDHRPSGFGVLYATKLIEDHHVFYCPDVKPIFECSPGARQANIDEFEARFENRDPVRCDYVIGYWVEPNWGPYPPRLGKDREGDKLETLKKDRVCWTADSSDCTYWWREYHPSSHDMWNFMNVGMLDASVRAVVRYRDELPQKGNYAYYWPFNDRPMWGWWEYFGQGKGL